MHTVFYRSPLYDNFWGSFEVWKALSSCVYPLTETTVNGVKCTVGYSILRVVCHSRFVIE